MWPPHQAPLVLRDFLPVWRSWDGLTSVPGAAAVTSDGILTLSLFCFQLCAVWIQLSRLGSEKLIRPYAPNEDGNRGINRLIDQSISLSVLPYRPACSARSLPLGSNSQAWMSKLYLCCTVEENLCSSTGSNSTALKKYSDYVWPAF